MNIFLNVIIILFLFFLCMRPSSHRLRDFSSTSTAQTEVEKLQGEVGLGRSREEKLADKVKALLLCKF